MIIHGNKQISEIVYARKASEGGGAVRLTNIIRGAQVVFSWLKYATTTAILAAFGQTDGKAVIKATNAYLNALAATNTNKASALAGFINEDPMLVCSLGLQPQGVQMPIRKIRCNGSQYIDTGLRMNPDGQWKIKYTLGTYDGKYPMLFGTQWDGGATGFAVDQNGDSSSMIQISDWIKSQSFSGDIELVLGWQGGSWNGTAFSTGKSKQTSGKTIWLGGVRGGYSKWRGLIESLEYNEGQGTLNWFVPYQEGEVVKWIDLLSGNKYTNLGSGVFEIVYRLPDGTPWTPFNQTP